MRFNAPMCLRDGTLHVRGDGYTIAREYSLCVCCGALLQPACEPVRAVSEPPERASCWDHYQAGARTSGVYVVDKGAGPMNMYCEMGLAGGGWDLVANVVGQSFRVRLVVMTAPLKSPSSCD